MCVCVCESLDLLHVPKIHSTSRVGDISEVKPIWLVPTTATDSELRSGFKVEARIWFRLVLEGLVGRVKVSLGECIVPPQK